MGERLRQVNREVKRYDSRLFAVQASTGVIHVLRKAEKWEAADALDLEDVNASLRPQFIFATTVDWTQSGSPVEWGLEPIMDRLRYMDSWTRSVRPLDQIRANRERRDADQKRSRINEARAIAADMRRDFARATNELRLGGN